MSTPLFQESFSCLPFRRYKNPELESGNKIIMPQSSLSLLLSLHVSYSFFFKIESFSSDKTSHCGVLEFGAEEGFIYMPRWIMKNLNIQDGDDVVLRDAALSKGVYMKLRPQQPAFDDPKAVLEKALGLGVFPCLSRGDTITVRHNETDFCLDVLDVNRGGEAVSLINTDCVLEFVPSLDFEDEDEDEEPPLNYDDDDDDDEEPPLDYEDEEKERDGDEQQKMNQIDDEVIQAGNNEFKPFTGVVRRLDGVAVIVKREKDGGEREQVREFQPFVGSARTVQGAGCSAVAGGPARAATEEGKKRDKYGGKDEAKEKFKPFTGRSRVLGGPNFFD